MIVSMFDWWFFRASKMLQRYEVKGHSMEPAFHNGDKLLLSSLFFNLREGDVVVFSCGSRDYLKRIKAVVGKNKFAVAGDNSSHSRSWNITRNQIKGKLLIKY